ncbi:hypothetical protein JC2156_00190 [Weissella koreensis KCTC 3621]|uniref:glycoside hydrolase domain-containing protein n=1 Tax=Weissella koreensis TaxID=165096 RepID=UPI00026F1891|nr:glycoside hydrolase domain-containing protein [Weissella koreensis]EJF34137.1 hypothetical protein JC2156_00190 [Weissella koreensis KCTC 3621]
MVLPNTNSSTADLTVFKGLLTSNGDTDRSALAFDTATQLSSSQIDSLWNLGYRYAGRYLTGSVGTGENERDKNLTNTEISHLQKKEFSIFPIYEDGGYTVKYFNDAQGIEDAVLAARVAKQLGLPQGTTIYFAADVDLLDTEIVSNLIPYIRNAKSYLASFGYTAGLYGTRNACLQAAQATGMKDFFLCDMSSGWSGNLGFKMPESWTFDQFFEETETGVGVDKVAYSGRDAGFNSIDKNQIAVNEAIKKLVPWFSLSLEGKHTIYDIGWMKLVTKATNSAGFGGDYDSTAVVDIKNGKISNADLSSAFKKFGLNNDTGLDIAVTSIEKAALTKTVKSGSLEMKYKVSNGDYTIEIDYQVNEIEEGYLDDTLTIGLEITLHWSNFLDALGALKEAAEAIASVVVLVSLAVIAVAAFPLDAVITPAAGILEAITLSIRLIVQTAFNK